ncbi:MAG: endolytic transglycosylase MltG [Butyrivibrio sp.]|nr:endolytic transglycosylase MltG [Butyrivibrio sp.]
MSARKIILGLLDTAVKVAFVIVVAMLISKYAKVAYNYGYHIFNQTPVSSGTGRTVTFTVGSGDSADVIAENLAGVGLITDKNLFKLQERFSEYHGMEQAGTYELSTSMTPEEMISIMSGGQKSADTDSEAATEIETVEEPEPEISTETEAESAGESQDG